MLCMILCRSIITRYLIFFMFIHYMFIHSITALYFIGYQYIPSVFTILKFYQSANVRNSSRSQPFEIDIYCPKLRHTEICPFGMRIDFNTDFLSQNAQISCAFSFSNHMPGLHGAKCKTKLLSSEFENCFRVWNLESLCLGACCMCLHR